MYCVFPFDFSYILLLVALCSVDVCVCGSMFIMCACACVSHHIVENIKTVVFSFHLLPHRIGHAISAETRSRFLFLRHCHRYRRRHHRHHRYRCRRHRFHVSQSLFQLVAIVVFPFFFTSSSPFSTFVFVDRVFSCSDYNTDTISGPYRMPKNFLTPPTLYPLNSTRIVRVSLTHSRVRVLFATFVHTNTMTIAFYFFC